MPRLPDRDPDDQAFAAVSARAPSGGPCPPADFVAGWVEGRLSDAEAAQVERHLAGCEACRGLARDLAPEVAAGARPWHLRAPVRAAAAVLVIATGLFSGVLIWKSSRTGPSPDGRLEGGTLAAACDELVRSNASDFAGFRPLSADELAAPGPGGLRGDGGAAILLPAARSLATRPRLVWEPPPGSSGEPVVAISSAAGVPLWSGRIASSEARGTSREAAYPAGAPALEPGGRYLLELTFEGVLGASSSRRVFEVAKAEDAARWTRQTDAVRRLDASPAIRALVRVHLAMRGGFLDEAERSAREAVSVAPAEAPARAALGRVLLDLGSAEASVFAQPASPPR